jgi:hypothetical protein
LFNDPLYAVKQQQQQRAPAALHPASTKANPLPQRPNNFQLNGRMPTGVSLPSEVGSYYSYKNARSIILRMPMEVSNAIQRFSQTNVFDTSQSANVTPHHQNGSPTDITNNILPSFQALPRCQCNNSTSNETVHTLISNHAATYLTTKSDTPISSRPKRAPTSFNPLPLMIVFTTNPITMTNKTYLKTNNTRTNDLKRSPPRKGTNNPG